MDQNIIRLAKRIISYSINIKSGERVLIDYEGNHSRDLVIQLIKEIYSVKAMPFVTHRDSVINRELMMECSGVQLNHFMSYKMKEISSMDAVITLRSIENRAELSDVPVDKFNLFMRETAGIKQYKIENLKWLLLHYPNPAMAQTSSMSQEAFEKMYFNVCTMNYNKMSQALDPLVHIMKKTDVVRIVGPRTNISFSIKGMGVVKCCGNENLPDGEIYTAPIKESVNGRIFFNVPSIEMGEPVSDICLLFDKGKVIEATSNNKIRLEKILDRDTGARYVGEFALGLNPYIKRPISNVIFDEKISGSFHIALGNSYKNAFNKNISSLHWDLVSMQTLEYGGGEIWFDNNLIRKDGMFLPKELHKLNCQHY